MYSFVMPAYNAPQLTDRALQTVRNAVYQLGWKDNSEFILLDDASDPSLGILAMFRRFREQSGVPTRILHFKVRQHYSRVLAAALSFARGSKVFFLSNDMVFTPDFFRTLLEVSDVSPSIGIVRGTSNSTDSHWEHTVAAPFPHRSVADILLFSNYVATYWKRHFVEDKHLSGDAVLINRALIDRIGVVDGRFFGYFGDVDYGIRAIRAGFKLVCAKGAWLYHEGGGHIKDAAMRANEKLNEHFAQRNKVAQEGYDLFREKWDPALPRNYQELRNLDFPSAKAREPLDLNQYVPPVTLSADIGEWV